MRKVLFSAVSALALAISMAAAAASFSYHGSLQDNGRPADGKYDLQLTLYSAADGGKVAGDRPLCEFESRYPGYGFAKHKGYPTAEHIAALQRLGPCAEHRRSFAPVRRVCACVLP